MKLPEEIIIDPIIYKIIYTETNNRLGYIDFNNTLIELLLGQPDNKMIQTLMHETVHAICEEAQIKISEKATDRLANTFMRFIRNNKELIKIMGGNNG